MVLLQLINHLINRYILSNWLSAKREFASTEKFFQVSLPLELEAQTGTKIFPKITSLAELFYVTGRTFLSEIFGNARFFLIFAHFSTSLDRMSGIFVFLNQFYVNFRKVTLATGSWSTPLMKTEPLKLAELYDQYVIKLLKVSTLNSCI